MDGEAEQVYSTQQAAAAVGVGAAMLRRYAQTLEKLTGKDIPHTRRDGRQFSSDHIRSFQHARALIDENTGLSVEAALKAVLMGGTTELIPASTPSSTLNTTALVNALRDAVTEPLSAELRELRREVRELQTTRETSPERTDPVPVQASPQPNDGLLVRAARWLEGRFRS